MLISAITCQVYPQIAVKFRTKYVYKFSYLINMVQNITNCYLWLNTKQKIKEL
jgi:hypothetical protein